MIRAMDETETYPVPPASRTPSGRLGEWVRRVRPTYLLQELIGAMPPTAALGLAGYYQSEIAHDVLGFAYPWAAVPAAAIEGGAAYCAVLYDRHLIAGDSTTALRLGMLGYAAGSSALLAWHAKATGKPWQISVALGLLTLSALFLWGRRGKWRKRATLREHGLLDAQMVRFAIYRYVFSPLETPAALRYAVKHSITNPETALAEYRKSRMGHPVPPPQSKVKATPPPVRQDAEGDAPVPPPTPPRRTPSRRSDPKVRPIGSGRGGDEAVLLKLRRAYPDREPTLEQVEKIAGGTRPRAVRLRNLLREQDGRTPAEEEHHPASRELAEAR